MTILAAMTDAKSSIPIGDWPGVERLRVWRHKRSISAAGSGGRLHEREAES